MSSNSSSGAPQPLPEEATVEVVEEVFEVKQRKSLFHYFDTEVEWWDIHGKKKTKESVTLESGWTWLTDWRNDGADAWEYSTKWNSSWSYAEGLIDFYKRRRWYRIRTKVGVTKAEIEKLKKSGAKFRIIKHQEGLLSKITNLQDKLKETLSVASQKVVRPNILLLGGSGAGKSSLINAVFGKPLAEIGEGKPITQSYTKFAGATSPVVIYDSKGIEHGSVENGFIADTKKFFKKLTKEPDLENHIHVVWYVIDLTQARFQPFEADFCRDILKDIPIIFVFNKADAVKSTTRDTMIETVAAFKLPNCRGIFATVANCKNFDRKDCPECGSGKIKKQLKEGSCTIICKECKKTNKMTKTSGIDELSRATLSVMPALVKDTFVHAQKSETLAKEIEAKKLIIAFSKDASLSRPETLSLALSTMTKRLIALYDAAIVGDIAEREVKRKFDIFFNEQKAAKKIQLFFNDLFAKKQTVAQAFIVCAGLEVCKTLIQFKNQTVSTAVQQTTETSSPSTPSTSEAATTVTPTTTVPPSPSTNLQKIVANLTFDIDSDMTHKIMHEIRKHGSITRYLKLIPIDGESSYITPEKQEVVEEEEDDFVAVSYQSADAVKPAESAPAPASSQPAQQQAAPAPQAAPQQ